MLHAGLRSAELLRQPEGAFRRCGNARRIDLKGGLQGTAAPASRAARSTQSAARGSQAAA